jgi:hypothetical protein
VTVQAIVTSKNLTPTAILLIDGFGLARVAKTHLPRLEVIYISGWIENAPRQEQLLGPLLRKPSDPETICKAARQLLGVL